MIENNVEDKFDDTKGVIRLHKSKKDNTMTKRKRAKGQTMIYKTLHRKIKIEQNESTFFQLIFIIFRYPAL
jgi:hypothetical protein